MSLEQALTDLANAIKAQTAALTANANGAPAKTVPTSTVKETAAPKAAAVAETDTTAETPKKPNPSTSKATSAPKAASAKAPAADEGVDPAYVPVKAAILSAIAGGHRTAVTALLKKHGAKTGQDLAPDVYDEVLGELDGIVNGEADLT